MFTKANCEGDTFGESERERVEKGAEIYILKPNNTTMNAILWLLRKKKNVIKILTLDGIQGNLINENSTSLPLKCIKCSLSSVAEPAPAPNF